MQRLKAILNAALARQAHRIRITAGSDAVMLLAGQVTEAESGGVVSEADLTQILAAIMPGQNFQADGVMQGSLNVGAQGVLKLRARQSPLVLDIYTPHSGDLFDRDASQPRGLPVVPQVVSIPPAPQSPPAFAVKAPPPPPESAPVLAAPATVNASAAPSAEPETEQMFRVASVPAKKPQAQTLSPSDVTSPPDGSGGFAPQMMPAQAIMMAPPVIVRPTEEEIEEINFGDKDATEGSVSHGNNPIDVLLKEMVQLKASDMPLNCRTAGDISCPWRYFQSQSGSDIIIDDGEISSADHSSEESQGIREITGYRLCVRVIRDRTISCKYIS